MHELILSLQAIVKPLQTEVELLRPVVLQLQLAQKHIAGISASAKVEYQPSAQGFTFVNMSDRPVNLVVDGGAKTTVKSGSTKAWHRDTIGSVVSIIGGQDCQEEIKHVWVSPDPATPATLLWKGFDQTTRPTNNQLLEMIQQSGSKAKINESVPTDTAELFFKNDSPYPVCVNFGSGPIEVAVGSKQALELTSTHMMAVFQDVETRISSTYFGPRRNITFQGFVASTVPSMVRFREGTVLAGTDAEFVFRREVRLPNNRVRLDNDVTVSAKKLVTAKVAISTWELAVDQATQNMKLHCDGVHRFSVEAEGGMWAEKLLLTNGWNITTEPDAMNVLKDDDEQVQVVYGKKGADFHVQCLTLDNNWKIRPQPTALRFSDKKAEYVVIHGKDNPGRALHVIGTIHSQPS
ncbi:hypothetical protein BJ741DRAFT_635465 [Chytriomyces cf. hyalinus JEL632]|nr:hypothetical protein BJ741DRAFT_635465 [Chytriomyces cf. hyalinus JEL632]